MSFSSKRAVYYFVNQLLYYLLIEYIKISAMLKRRQFKDSESGKTESSISKCQRLDINDNKKRQGLNKYKGKHKCKRYVPFPFIIFFPLP